MPPRPEAIACVDIGKTNRRVVLVDRETGAELGLAAEANASLTGGSYPALDLDAMIDFIESALTRFARLADIRHVAISGHGAAFVALAGDRPALPALDYEHSGPDTIAADYARLRPPFSETFSPALPGGLNAGRGLYWLSRAFPEDFARADAILSLNQYIAFQLSGVRASECTALGAHTDLWDAGAQRLSTLVDRLGWTRRFPPLRRPGEPLGPILPDLAARTGLSRDARVLCGIHDSNATLVPYLAGDLPRATILSTGTWIIGFSLGGATDDLDEARDCLANSDYLGRPVPSARIMGGRELAILTGGATDRSTPLATLTPADIPLPAFVPRTGPFGGRAGQLPEGWANRPAGERAGLAAIYCAFNCAVMTKLIDGAGPIIVEGVFARNPAFLDALARVTGAPILTGSDATGTIAGLTTLAGLVRTPELVAVRVDETKGPALRPIFRAWLDRAGAAT